MKRQMQRALIQYRNPANRVLVREALLKAGREDLIGYGPKCLLRPDQARGDGHAARRDDNRRVEESLQVEDGEHRLEELLTVTIRRAAVRTRDRLRNAARHRRKRPSEMYTERSRDR